MAPADDASALAELEHCPRCAYGIFQVIASDAVAKLQRCFVCDHSASSLIEPLTDPDSGDELNAADTNLALGLGEGKTAIEAATSPSGASTLQAHGAIAAAGSGSTTKKKGGA